MGTIKQDFAKDSKYAIENDEKYYFSDLPFHLYSMLKDITSLPQEVPKNVINQIAENVCEQYGLFCFQLTTAVEKYKKEHLQNRDSTKQFTVTVVRTANDLHVSHKNVNNLLTKFLQESKKLQALTGSFNLAIKST
uniref:Uncharacterized protein n=1 Tax=Panagrolaimus superbus TaxID=310955 RepID=A0A914XZM7_9BILA